MEHEIGNVLKYFRQLLICCNNLFLVGRYNEAGQIFQQSHVPIYLKLCYCKYVIAHDLNVILPTYFYDECALLYGTLFYSLIFLITRHENIMPAAYICSFRKVMFSVVFVCLFKEIPML